MLAILLHPLPPAISSSAPASFPLVLILFDGTVFPPKILGGPARGLTYQTLVNAFLFTVTKGRKEGRAIYVAGCTLAMMTMTTINYSEGLSRPTFGDDFFTAV